MPETVVLVQPRPLEKWKSGPTMVAPAAASPTTLPMTRCVDIVIMLSHNAADLHNSHTHCLFKLPFIVYLYYFYSC